jgi:hypothetical protein
MPSQTTVRIGRLTGGGLLALAGAALALTAWLFASPPGSSPDDGYHLGSIWCANGYVPDRCLESPGTADPDIAIAPSVLAELTCVAGDGRKSAACQNGIYERNEGRLSPTVTNISGRRATLYYRMANLLVTDDISATIARIRVMNASLVLLLVGATAGLAAPDVRRAVLASWLVASLPHGLFLVTSLNSTAWGLIGIGIVLANAVTALRPGALWRRGLAGALALAGAGMGLGSRTEAAAHLSVIVLAITVLWLSDIWRGGAGLHLDRSRRRAALLIGLPAVLAVTLIVRFSALPNLLGVGSGLASGWDRLVRRGISNPALTLAAETPQLWTGALGTWSLGWLDTNMPSTVSVSATVGFVALIVLGAAGASRGRSLSMIVVFLGMIALPVVSLLSVGLVVLEELQPRHYLPLLYAFLAFALIRSPGQPPLEIGRGMRISLASILTVGHSVALIVNIRRYTHGLTEFLYINTNRDQEWWWGGSVPSPELVWAFGSVGYGVLAFTVLGLFTVRTPARGRVLSRPGASR